ncbi:MAG: MFS transporter [Burkholderiaceae bacterium]
MPEPTPTMTRPLPLQRRFGPFFLTQALGAFNDNLFKNVLILLVTFHTAQFTTLDPALVANLAAGLFILPFVLFSAGAGRLADHMDKAHLMRIVKTTEIGIVGLAGFGLYDSNLTVLLGALFLMGTHSTFFGPVKYALLPQVLTPRELLAGNAWLEAATFIVILLGTLAAAGLVALTRGPLSIGVALLGVALLGWAASFAIPAAPAMACAAPRAQLRDFSPWAWWPLLQRARHHDIVWTAMLGISWFWLVGSVLLAQLPILVKTVVGGDMRNVSTLLAVFSLGIGLGSLLCVRFSRRCPTTLLLLIGGLGISACLFDLWWACHHLPAPIDQVGTLAWTWLQQPIFQRMLLDLGCLGIAGGLFAVPLYTQLQRCAPPAETARMVAANNVLNALFMVFGAGVAAGSLAAGATVVSLMLALSGANVLVILLLGVRLHR